MDSNSVTHANRVQVTVAPTVHTQSTLTSAEQYQLTQQIADAMAEANRIIPPRPTWLSTPAPLENDQTAAALASPHASRSASTVTCDAC